MKNGTGSSDSNTPRPAHTDLIQPLGTLRVSFTDGFGQAHDRLDNVRAGMFAIATGTIANVHLHGDDEEPRATFTLVGPAGDSAIVAVPTDPYFEFFGWLVDGRTVTAHGTVIRPFAKGPSHIQLLSLHIA